MTTCLYRHTFFTILGVSFCVMRKTFKFINIKNNNVITYFIKSSIKLSSTFLKFDGVVGTFAFHKKSHYDGSIVIFDGCWIFFKLKLALVLRPRILKNLACPLLISNVIFMFGYYNEFTLSR